MAWKMILIVVGHIIVFITGIIAGRSWGESKMLKTLIKMYRKFVEIHESHLESTQSKIGKIVLLNFMGACMLEVWSIPAPDSLSSKQVEVMKAHMVELEKLRLMHEREE